MNNKLRDCLLVAVLFVGGNALAATDVKDNDWWWNDAWWNDSKIEVPDNYKVET